MYLIRTLRRRYSRKPYSGDFSSYWATAVRTSAAPPAPRVRISTASLEAYLSRNLEGAETLALAQSGGVSRTRGRDEPSSSLGEGGLVGFGYLCIVEAIQRHGEGDTRARCRAKCRARSCEALWSGFSRCSRERVGRSSGWSGWLGWSGRPGGTVRCRRQVRGGVVAGTWRAEARQTRARTICSCRVRGGRWWERMGVRGQDRTRRLLGHGRRGAGSSGIRGQAGNGERARGKKM